ncbi:hypothetical protein GCM10010271_69490 [Streptomyces kurssanovii]|nr:hypothetical protein GCM10010271_69490 [Streptomyces kurssanovii]
MEPLLGLLRQQRRAVPEDISVVAICPEQIAVHASVRLTSVAIPARDMARHAVEQVVAKIEGRAGDEVVLLEPELTVRASSGPAPFRCTSSRGYTLLWNNPAIGRVELARTGTRWVADSARQIDYWITAGAPAAAQRRYSAVTGRTPMLPE